MTTTNELITEAFPSSRDGYPICCHCGGRRPGYLLLCMLCWNRLSQFSQRAIVDARGRTEKARLVLASRPVMR